MTVVVHPVKVVRKSTFAAVIFPFESLVKWNVIVALPVPVDSALVMGGTSWAGDMAAVYTKVVGCPDGPFGLSSSSSHDAPTIARAAIAQTARRFMARRFKESAPCC